MYDLYSRNGFVASRETITEVKSIVNGSGTWEEREESVFKEEWECYDSQHRVIFSIIRS